MKWLILLVMLTGCASGVKYFRECEKPGDLYQCKDEVK